MCCTRVLRRGGVGVAFPLSCDPKPMFCGRSLGREALSHSRHVAGMFAVSHSRHVCCAAQRTCLLCHTADMSAMSHSRIHKQGIYFARRSANSQDQHSSVRETQAVPRHLNKIAWRDVFGTPRHATHVTCCKTDTSVL